MPLEGSVISYSRMTSVTRPISKISLNVTEGERSENNMPLVNGLVMSPFALCNLGPAVPEVESGNHILPEADGGPWIHMRKSRRQKDRNTDVGTSHEAKQPMDPRTLPLP